MHQKVKTARISASIISNVCRQRLLIITLESQFPKVAVEIRFVRRLSFRNTTWFHTLMSDRMFSVSAVIVFNC